MEKEQKQEQQPQEGVVMIPREYVLKGVKDAVDAMYKMMREARVKYGNNYNWKNDYEQCDRRFKLSDHEAVLNEYDLIRAKQSKQPSVIRGVIRQIGDNAVRNGCIMYAKDQKAKAQQEEKQ